MTQAAFEKAFRSLGSFSAEGPFGAWLRRIVVNQGLDHLRRDRRRRAAEVALDDVALDWEGASAEPELAAAIRRLGADRRAVVVLHHWLGYTLAEAAELLAIPVTLLGTPELRFRVPGGPVRIADGANGWAILLGPRRSARRSTAVDIRAEALDAGGRVVARNSARYNLP